MNKLIRQFVLALIRSINSNWFIEIGSWEIFEGGGEGSINKEKIPEN
jgi:hypothetical protein